MPLLRPTHKRKPLPQAGTGAPTSVLRRVQQRVTREAQLPCFAGVLQPPPARHDPALPQRVAGALLGGSAAVGAFLAGLEGALVLSAGLLVLAAGGAGWAWKAGGRAAAVQPVTPVLDMDAALQLDALLAHRAEELPAAALDALRAVATTLQRMLPRLQAGPPGPPWRMDDTMFLTQLLRRYLPDSLQHFLQVPVAQRTQPLIAGGRTPADELLQQLRTLQAELQACEQRLAEAAADGLALQGAFLQSRRRD